MSCIICKVLLPKTAGAARRNVEQPAEESISEYDPPKIRFDGQNGGNIQTNKIWQR